MGPRGKKWGHWNAPLRIVGPQSASCFFHTVPPCQRLKVSWTPSVTSGDTNQQEPFPSSSSPYVFNYSDRKMIDTLSSSWLRLFDKDKEPFSWSIFVYEEQETLSSCGGNLPPGPDPELQSSYSYLAYLSPEQRQPSGPKAH